MRMLYLMFVTCTLASCSTVSVPDMTYYRLPAAQAVDPVRPQQVLPLPIDVSVFAADGLYAEQSIIYATDTEARALRGYHYQLWSDPPSRMLQRRLIDLLRRAAISPLVTDRLPTSTDALRIDAVILRYDRTPGASGYAAHVSLQLRVARGTEHLSEKVYKSEEPAISTEIGHTVEAFGRAVDRIYANFLLDLLQLKLESHP